MRSFLFLLALIVMPSLAAGCGKKIGDDCRVNIDCSINGDRVCDTAQPGGYCTVEGCDERSCPDDSVCVRFFPVRFVDSAALACDARTEDDTTDVCTPDETCVPAGVCVPRSTERRYCEQSCGDDGDCRDGYRCRRLGVDGAFALPQTPNDGRKFCSPR